VKYLSFLFALFLSINSYTQYTEVINSKRPGFSESPFGLGTKVYQVESGYFYQYDGKPELLNIRKQSGIDLFLRSGLFWEKFEFNANFKIQNDKLVNDTITLNTNSHGGISQFTLGAKYLFYMPKYKDPSKEIRSWKAKVAFDWKRFIPSVGLYLGLNTNLLGKYYKAPSMSPKAVILLQNDFSEKFIVVTNLIGDYLTINDKRNLSYIATFTYSFSEKFSIFGEHQGIFSKNKKFFDIGGGAAYLFNKDFQIGINMRTDTQFDYLNLYGGIGLSYRIDRHKDKEIFQKPNKDGTGRVQYKKESFFKRLFSRNSRRSRAPKVRKVRRRRIKGKSRKARRREEKLNQSKEPKERRKRRKRKPRRRRNRRSRTRG
jgi:hypothetical protein